MVQCKRPSKLQERARTSSFEYAFIFGLSAALLVTAVVAYTIISTDGPQTIGTAWVTYFV